MSTTPLEAAVVHAICNQLENLGWTVDERSPDNNVTQQRPKTEAERQRLRQANGRPVFPDFVLYEQGTTRAIAIIEAKKPGASLDQALQQAEDRYARPLATPLVFAYNDTFVAARYLQNGRSLKIDGEDVRQFVDHYTALRFVNEGPEILSAPESVQVSRNQLIRIFKRQNNLLREAGIQAGLDRFSAFSDILFLKLINERAQLRRAAGLHFGIPQSFLWDEFQDKSAPDRLDYVRSVVWPRMNQEYGDIFSGDFPIASPEIFHDIVQELSQLNFTATDSDVKGDAFEYFLKNAYQSVGINDLGEYFTPRNIVRTMVSMVDPQIGETVYDPFCGTGGFLIEAFRYLELRTKRTAETEHILKDKTVYGSEHTVTARAARMNMILYGDGHNNVLQQDTFATPPCKEKYDIVLTNPPFSQDTRHGNLYKIPSRNGDAVAIQHILAALAPSGRAAFLVKEDFLTKGGAIGKVRDMVLNMAKNFSIVSLPRRLFEPYTPTKTSIIYLEKDGRREDVFFFVVRNVGHSFGARKVSRPENDLPGVLSNFNDRSNKMDIDSAVIPLKDVQAADNSLWIYDYIDAEDGHIGDVPLGEQIEPSGEYIDPSETEDATFRILGVSNTHGVFLDRKALGGEIKQTYTRVQENDLVYNPHRVNVGSIGLVPVELAGGIVSGIYVVFRPRDNKTLPSEYLLRLLKSEPYRRVINAYDTKTGAVRGNLNWKQLCRIKIRLPGIQTRERFAEQQRQFAQVQAKHQRLNAELNELVMPPDTHVRRE